MTIANTEYVPCTSQCALHLVCRILFIFLNSPMR